MSERIDGVQFRHMVVHAAAAIQLEKQGINPYHSEGFDSKNWILLDYSSVIVHIFVPNTRTFYDLEHLWADGEPVDISAYLDSGEQQE